MQQTHQYIPLFEKAGSLRQIVINAKWHENTPEPKLLSLTVNGIPYTCATEETHEVEKPARRRPIQTTTEIAPVEPVDLPENIRSERGVYVPWPKKVLGLYVLLADDDHDGYERLQTSSFPDKKINQ